jgi:hypothetical protein
MRCHKDVMILNRFLIVFPNDLRLDFYIDDLEIERFNGEFPLFETIRRHIERHEGKTDGAKVYEVVKGKEKNHYVHLTTFNY